MLIETAAITAAHALSTETLHHAVSVIRRVITGLSTYLAATHLSITPLIIAAATVRHHSALAEAHHSALVEAARLEEVVASRVLVQEEEDNV